MHGHLVKLSAELKSIQNKSWRNGSLLFLKVEQKNHLERRNRAQNRSFFSLNLFYFFSILYHQGIPDDDSDFDKTPKGDLSDIPERTEPESSEVELRKNS